MATLSELQTRLTALNTAITAVEGGAQFYGLPGGLQVNRGNLASMYAERDKLESRIARLDGSKPFAARVDLSGAF